MHRVKSLLLAATLLAIGSGTAAAGWETGAKLGFDTNVDRALDGNGKSDGTLSAYAAYGREPSGDLRTDWFVTAVAEGSAYFSVTDLDSASLTVTPGLVFTPRPGWTMSASVFLQGKSVQDGNQSATAVGGRLGMKQRLPEEFVLGEHYAYTRSHANEEVFSFDEHALGATLSRSFGPKISGEIGYEYGRGDSFRTLASTAAAGTGGVAGGMPHMFSSAFGAEVAKERVDRHSIGTTWEVDWTKALFSALNYTYTLRHGDLGQSASHTGFVGLGYRF